MSIPIPPIKTQLVGEALDLGITELNATAKSVGHVTIEFSTLLFYKVYSLHNVTVAKMKVREGALIKQVRVSNRTINKMKKTFKGKNSKSRRRTGTGSTQLSH